MKKTLKKIIAVCLAAICLMPVLVYADDAEVITDELIAEETTEVSAELLEETAAEEIENEIPEEIEMQASLLNALSILPDNIDFEAEITREETAVLLVKMLAKDEAARSAANFSYYTDVSVYSDSVGYINVATNEGLFKGRSETIFDPEAAITYAELSKLLVGAVGYSVYADRKGGFPSGYLATASQLKIFKDVSLDGKTMVNWLDAIKMVYNTMQVDILSGVLYTAEGDYLEIAKTTGENIIKVNHNLYEAKGQITGTAVCKMFGRGSDRDLEPGEIEINGKLYSYDVEKLAHLEELTGYRVDYIYRENQNAEYELVYAYINASSAISVMSYDITKVYGFDSGETGDAYLEYFINDDPTMEEPEELDLEKKISLIVNNVKKPRVTNTDLYPECGKVTLIDSDDDGVYDVAKVVQYDMRIVDTVSIYDKHIYFKNDPTTTPLVLNPVYEDVSYIVTHDGERISLNALREGDILGIVKSTKGKAPYYQIELLSQAVKGTVEEFGSEEIVIDGKTYKVSMDFDFAAYDIHPGDYCELYFDFADKLFFIEKEDEKVPFEYVLIGAERKGGLKGKVQAKLYYSPDTRGKKVLIFDFAEKVEINGKKHLAADCVEVLKLSDRDKAVIGHEYLQPLRYVEFDDEGKIKMIETVTAGTTSTKANRTYRGTGPYNEAFSDIFISYQTHIFYIPQSMKDEDFYFTEYNKLKFGTSHPTVMWGHDSEDPECPEVVFLWHNRTNSDPSFNINYERPMIVNDIWQVYNKSKEEVQYKVETFNSGGTFTYPSDVRNPNTSCFENIKTGDIIFAALSSETESKISKVQYIVGGDMWSCDKLISLSDPSLYYYSLTEHLYGRIDTIRTLPRENKCNIQIYVGESELKTVSLTGVPIYYYDLAKNEISMGTYAAIRSAEAYGEQDASRVFIFFDVSDPDDNGQFKPIMAVIVDKN